MAHAFFWETVSNRINAAHRSSQWPLWEQDRRWGACPETPGAYCLGKALALESRTLCWNATCSYPSFFPKSGYILWKPSSPHHCIFMAKSSFPYPSTCWCASDHDSHKGTIRWHAFIIQTLSEILKKFSASLRCFLQWYQWQKGTPLVVLSDLLIFPQIPMLHTVKWQLPKCR